MEDKLLTQQDLAKRWQVTVATIENYRKEGILQPVKGIPVIRFSLHYILELEGVKLEQFSPILKRRMEREIEELRQENQRLKEIIGGALAVMSPAIGMKDIVVIGH